jgi:hypothetical protein
MGVLTAPAITICLIAKPLAPEFQQSAELPAVKMLLMTLDVYVMNLATKRSFRIQRNCVLIGGSED